MENIWDVDINALTTLHEKLYKVNETGSVERLSQSEKQLKIHLSAGLQADDRLFLLKVMSSVGQTDADFDIVVHDEFDLDHVESAMLLGSKHLIFGSLLDISTDKYAASETKAGLPYYIFDSLSDIKTDVTKKRQLWDCLKEVFGQSQN